MADTSAKDGIIVEVRPQKAYSSVDKSFGLGATGKAFFWSNRSDITGAEQLLSHDFAITASHEYDYLRDPLVKWGPFSVRLSRNVDFVDYLRDNGIELRGAYITVYPADQLTKTCAELDALTAAQALTYTATLAYVGGTIDGISEGEDSIEIRASWDDSYYETEVNPPEVIGGQSWQPPINVGQLYHVAHKGLNYEQSTSEIIASKGGEAANSYPIYAFTQDLYRIRPEYVCVRISLADLTNDQIAEITAGCHQFSIKINGIDYEAADFVCCRVDSTGQLSATLSGNSISGYTKAIGSAYVVLLVQISNNTPIWKDISDVFTGEFSKWVTQYSVLSDGKSVYATNPTGADWKNAWYEGSGYNLQKFRAFNSDGRFVDLEDGLVAGNTVARRKWDEDSQTVKISGPIGGQTQTTICNSYATPIADIGALAANQYAIDGYLFTQFGVPTWNGTVTESYNAGSTALGLSFSSHPNGVYYIVHYTDIDVPLDCPSGAISFGTVFSAQNHYAQEVVLKVYGIRTFDTVETELKSWTVALGGNLNYYVVADESGANTVSITSIEGDSTTANKNWRVVIPTLGGGSDNISEYQKIRVKISFKYLYGVPIIFYAFDDRPRVSGGDGLNWSVMDLSESVDLLGDDPTVYGEDFRYIPALAKRAAGDYPHTNNGEPSYKSKMTVSLFGGKVSLRNFLSEETYTNCNGGFSLHDPISRKDLLYHFLRTDEGYLYTYQQYGYILPYKSSRPTSFSNATPIDLTRVNSCRVRNMERGEFVGGVVVIRYGSNPSNDDGCAYTLRIGGSTLEYPTQDYFGVTLPAPSASVGQRAKVGFGLIGDAMGDYAGDQCKDVLVMPWIQTAEQAMKHADNLAFDMGVRKSGGTYSFFAPYYADISYVATSPDLRYMVGDVLDLTGLGELGTPTRAYGIVVQSEVTLRNASANDYNMIVKVFAENDPAVDLTYIQDIYLSTSPATYIQDQYLNISPSSYIEDTELAEV